jgi:hypothetical protein
VAWATRVSLCARVAMYGHNMQTLQASGLGLRHRPQAPCPPVAAVAAQCVVRRVLNNISRRASVLAEATAVGDARILVCCCVTRGGRPRILAGCCVGRSALPWRGSRGGRPPARQPRWEAPGEAAAVGGPRQIDARATARNWRKRAQTRIATSCRRLSAAGALHSGGRPLGHAQRGTTNSAASEAASEGHRGGRTPGLQP